MSSWIDPAAGRLPVLQDSSEARNRRSNQFKFISGLDNSYTKATRAHVLKRHFSEKRKLRPSSCRRNTKLRNQSATGNQEQVANCGPPKDLENWVSFEQRHGLLVGNLLFTAIQDPFSTFARPLTAREWRFVDYYINESMKLFDLAPDTKFYPPRVICLPVIIQDEAAIEAMIAYGAIGIGNSTSVTPLEAFSSRTKSIHQVNERLSNPERRFSNPTISAIIGLAAHLTDFKSEVPQLFPEAVSFEEELEIHAHWQGLRQIIIARGGFQVIAEDVEMSWIVHWVDIVSLGELSAGLTPLSTHYRHPDGQGCEAIELPTYIEEFIGAYNDFYNASFSRTLCLIPTCGPQPHIHRLFQTGTPFRRLLTDPSSSRLISKTAVLLYLNILLSNYENQSSSVVANSFKRVRQTMTDVGLDIAGKIEVLFWILITNPNDHRLLEDPSKMQLLARLLYVEKSLSRALRVELEVALLQFLSAGGTADLATTPDPLHFRRDVTRDWAWRKCYATSSSGRKGLNRASHHNLQFV